jgi:glycosyltransferase involved in cell wall biosynthesis
MQTYLPMEIIISDDSEENVEFLHVWIAKHETGFPRIRYIKNPGVRGIFSNLNHAIQHTDGEFIQLFCQDDEMMPHLMEHHVSILRQYNKVGIVFSQFDSISEEGVKEELEKRHNYRKQFPDYIPGELMLHYLLMFGCLPGNLSPVMMKKEVISLAGLFDQAYPVAGDFEYWSRSAEFVDFYFIKESSLYIRQHPFQASRTLPNTQLIKDRISIYTTLLKSQKSKLNYPRTSWYLNQTIGTQHFHFLLKTLLRGRFRWNEISNYMKLLNKKPFDVFQSFSMYIITMNGRIQWLRERI